MDNHPSRDCLVKVKYLFPIGSQDTLLLKYPFNYESRYSVGQVPYTFGKFRISLSSQSVWVFGLLDYIDIRAISYFIVQETYYGGMSPAFISRYLIQPRLFAH